MIGDLIPPKVRKTIYVILSTAYGLELIFDLIPAGTENKVLQALAFLGFGMAAINTQTKPQEG